MANIPEEFRLIMERHGEIKEEVHRSVPVFENCVNYRMDEVIALSKLIRGCVEEPSSDKRKEMKTQLALSLDQIRPVREQRKILLWPEGRMPAETDYKDNSDLRYNHDPDFIPYMYEILCDENVTPKGAIVVVAGGDHGECVIAEGYQTCLDFRERGYQCFLLLNRTNHNPWSAKESGADAARAIRYIRKNHEAYRIGENCVAYAGFSNGGVTGEGCIRYFSGKQSMKDAFPAYEPDELDSYYGAPDAFLCVYGPRIRPNEGSGILPHEEFDYTDVVYPPTFFAVGKADTAVLNLEYVYPELIAHGVDVEVHTFAGVPHGQAGRKITDGVQYPNFELWIPLADHFMQYAFAKKG